MDDPKKKLKVLHLIETLGSGGAERLLFTNLKHLDRDAIDSEVVTVFGRDQYWREPIMQLGVRVTDLECSGYRDIPAGVSRLRKHMATSMPDLVHTHLFTANIIGRIAGHLSSIPVISSVHNPEYEPEAAGNASSSTRNKIGMARIVDKITARYACARMIAVSRYVKESTVRRLGYPASKIDVVYNPIDLSEIDKHQDRSRTLQSLDIPAGSVFLLHVGRLSPQKGFIDAVHAMPEILAHAPSAQLVSVGAQADREYKSKVLEAIDSLGVARSVRLCGERRDVSSLMSACDVFVFPSHFEGLGIALVEAMAAGRACVASDIKPLTEFIKHDVNGVLVPPHDRRSLAKAIIDLISDPNKGQLIGEAARATAFELFRPDAAAAKLTEIYYSTAITAKT